MNEQKHTANELHRIIAELNDKMREAKSLGLTVEIHNDGGANLLSDNPISCDVYSITSFNQE